MDRNKEMQNILNEILDLKASPLYKIRKESNYKPVIGEGNLYSKIMFVGEAPGENEAKTGKPFCGRSGKVLDSMLASVGLPREDVYITSVVKDRPPKNRDPKPEEIEIYSPFLDRQIEIIKPHIIVTLGRFGMEYIMKRYGLENEIAPIGKIHGQIFDTEINNLKVKIVALYHPASALYNPKLKESLMEDFKVLRAFI